MVIGAAVPLAVRLTARRLPRLIFRWLEDSFTVVASPFDHIAGCRISGGRSSGKDLETAIESVLRPGRWLVFFDYKTGGNAVILFRRQQLRSYNAAQFPGRRVRLYGIDIGQQLPYDQSVEAVLTFLDHADADLGRELRRQYGDVISVFRSDRYVKLTSADNLC